MTEPYGSMTFRPPCWPALAAREKKLATILEAQLLADFCLPRLAFYWSNLTQVVVRMRATGWLVGRNYAHG